MQIILSKILYILVLQSVIVQPSCASTWCYGRLLTNYIESQANDVTVISISVNSSIWIDSVVIVPLEFSTGVIHNITIDVPQDCDLMLR